MSADSSLLVTSTTRAAIRRAVGHVEAMRRERQGWGPEAEQQVVRTERSLLAALAHLNNADEVWADGFDDLAFGGEIAGIVFGVIPHRKPEPQFVHPEIEWSLHS